MDVGTVITNSLYSILNKCLGSEDLALQVVQDFIHTTVKELGSQQVLDNTVLQNKQEDAKVNDESKIYENVVYVLFLIFSHGVRGFFLQEFNLLFFCTHIAILPVYPYQS